MLAAADQESCAACILGWGQLKSTLFEFNIKYVKVIDEAMQLRERLLMAFKHL
jgi:hypothetical protein